MAEQQPNDSANGASSAGPKRDVQKLIALGLAALNLVAAGIGLGLTYKATLGWEREAITEESSVEALKKARESEGVRESILYTLPTFTVNLDGQPSRILRVELTLDMLDKDGFEEIVQNSPAARDAIVRILNGKTYDELETIQGKLFLKDQISVSLNQHLELGVVKDVYFSEFLIQ